MNQITQAEVAGSYASTSKTIVSEKTDTKKYKVNGATIGSPTLSEKGKKYYEQLRKKYANMDFILVSEDKKAEAQANAGRYANPNRMVVLIDTEKIERMAEDEEYRKQYEAVIANAGMQFSHFSSRLGERASYVKTYGMQVNEKGVASFFAVIDKSLAAQRERIKENAAKKADEKKEAQKTAEEKRAEEAKEEDLVTVTASSVEELLKKVNEVITKGMSDYIRTEEETWVGGHVDFYG